MSFNPQKIETPLSKTRAGQRTISKIKSSTFLPSVFRSGLNERWLDATLDLMISKGDLEDITGYVGSSSGGSLNSIRDVYINTKDYRQLLPAVVSLQENGEVKDVVSWDQIYKATDIEFNDFDYNSAYSAKSYVFNPPINTDKFINYNQYYWCPELPAATLTLHSYQGQTGVFNPIDELQGKVIGTFPHDVFNRELDVWERKELTIYNNMVVKFQGDGYDPAVTDGTEWLITNVGRSIRFLVRADQHDILPFTKFLTDAENPQGPKVIQPWQDKCYTVCSVSDQVTTGFSRANRWIHVQALRDMADADSTFPRQTFLDEQRKGKRPIIEFERNLEMFNVPSGGVNLGIIDKLLSSVAVTDDNGVLRLDIADYAENQKVIVKVDENDPAVGQENFPNVYLIKLDVDGAYLEDTGIAINNQDYFTVLKDLYHNQSRYSQYDFMFDGNNIILMQSMELPHTQPLFNLKDYQGLYLENYSSTTFNGNKIFGYKIGNGKIDPELGFAPVYKDLGVKSDIVFENYIDTVRYYSQEYLNSVETEIIGDYFYDYGGGRSNTNYIPTAVLTGAKSHVQIIADNQYYPSIEQTPDDITIAVGKHIWLPEIYYNFSLIDDKPVITEVINNKKYNKLIRTAISAVKGSTLVFYDKSPDSRFDIVDRDGLATITVTGNTHTIELPDVENYVLFCRDTVSGTRVRLVTSNEEVYYKKYLDIHVNGQEVSYDKLNITDSEIIILGEGLDNSNYHVVDLYCYSNYPDFEAVPDVFINNPTNEKVSDITITETLAHWTDILANQPGFQGSSFGANNYDYIPKVTNVGGKIFVTDQSNIVYNYTFANSETDITQALTTQAEEWQSFRQRAMTQARNIFKKNGTISNKELTDQVIDFLVKNSKNKQLHKKSNMVFSNQIACAEVFTYQSDNNVYIISDSEFNRDTYVKDHYYVYIIDNMYGNNQPASRILINEEQYYIQDNKLTIIYDRIDMTPFTDGSTIKFELYKHDSLSDCFVPASLTKLGLSNTVVPKPLEQGGKLICHDGWVYDSGRTTTEFENRFDINYDPAGAVLYELELRIWNNLVLDSNDVDYTHFMPSFAHSMWYDRQVVDDYIERFFLQWQKKNKVELNSEDYFDANDPTTWNYSTVSVAGKLNNTVPGHWVGAYKTIFGTDRPHTNPWEMLGLTTPPSWWDYNWTDPTKRADLINLLKYGIVSGPDNPITQDLKFASDWDWENKCPVDLDGNLVSPELILGSPTEVDRSAPFKFGDWSPAEAAWRNSPVGVAVMLDAVIKLNPTHAWLNMFQTTNCDYTSAPDGSIINKLTKKQFRNKDRNYHGESFNKQVKKIKISSYDNSDIPEGTKVVILGGTVGVTATANLIISNGKAVSVSVQSKGNGYLTIPNISLDYSDADPLPVDEAGNTIYPKIRFDVELEDNFEYYKGLDQLLYLSVKRAQSDTVLSSVYKTLHTRLVQPLAGFTSKEITRIESDSGYNGEFILGDNDFSIEMTGGYLEHLVVASSIIITKTDSGYIIDGYSNHRQEFLFFEPIGDYKLVELPDGTIVKQYSQYSSTPSAIAFGTKLARIQDVYDFIIGYNMYLASMGISLNEQKSVDGPANQFVSWAQTANIGTSFEVQLGQSISMIDSEFVVLPFGSLPGKVNSIIAKNSNGEIVNSSMNDMCITRVDDTLNVHPVGVNPTGIEPGESIVTVITSSTTTTTNNNQFSDGISGGHIVTDSNGNTVFVPAIPNNQSTEISSDANTTSQSSSDTQYESIQGAGVIGTLQPETILSVSFALARFTHAILFNNKTSFNEPILDNILNNRVERFKLLGQRTRNWSGKKYAPGYLVMNNTIIQNFDTLVEDVNDYYDLNAVRFNKNISKLERMTLGLGVTEWIKKINLPDNVINKFMLGVLKHKGSSSVIDKVNRTDKIKQGNSLVDYDEYWMFRGQNFGDTAREHSTEIKLTSDLVNKNQSVIDITDINLEYVNLEKQTTFKSVSFEELGITQRKAGDLQIGDYDYIAADANAIPNIFDNSADYAVIPTWSGRRSYKKGDVVRRNGNLYECNVPYIGYRELSEAIIVSGTLDLSDVTFPNATPGAIIDNVDINFNKQVIVYPDIVATGAENPVLDGSFMELIIDNQWFVPFRATGEEIIRDLSAENNGLPTAKQFAPHDETADVTSLELVINNVTINLDQIGNLNNSYTGTIEENVTHVVDQLVYNINIPTGNVNGTETLSISNSFTIDYLAETITFDVAPTQDFTITYSTDVPYPSVTQQELVDAINNSTDFSDLGITASIDNGVVEIVRDQGPINDKLPIVISVVPGTDGNQVMKLVPGTYEQVTTTQTVDAEIDLAGIVEILNDYFTNNNIDGTYSAGVVNNRLVITKLSTSGLGANSTLEFDGSVRTELGLLDLYEIGAGYYEPRESTPQEVVTYINNTNIPGVTASFENNRIVITKLSDFGTNIDIGNTAFNTLAGIPAGIIPITGSGDNQFIASQWTNISDRDPALFNIWVLNDSELKVQAIGTTTSAFNNWNLLQMQRIPAYAILDAGNESVDGNDAKVSMYSANNVEYLRSALRVGDYVMLLNTDSTPQVTGIHQITSFENTDTNSFYIDKFIENGGRAEAIFVLRNARFNSYDDMINSLQETNQYYNTIKNQLMFITELNDVAGNYVYQSNNDGTASLIRNKTWYIDNSEIENIRIYNAQTQQPVADLEVIDPLQGIIAGAAAREIDFRYPVDVASYNMSNDENYNTNQRNFWGEDQVGKIWWDTSTVYYLDYKLGDSEYARENWGKQADGSSIDVYEWTKSTVTPDKWADQVKSSAYEFGAVATGEAYRIFDAGSNTYLDYYVEDTVWNEQFNRYDSVYYFWVKNKTTITSREKTLPVISIASIIDNPTANGIRWAAAIDKTKFMVNNVQQYVNDDNSVIQINLKSSGSIHSNWTQISEGSEEIPDYYFVGLRDNLVGTQSVSNNPLPDKTLHEFNRYGDDRNLTFKYTNKKHSQAWFKDTWDARREAIYIINDLLLHQNLKDHLDGKWNRILSQTFYIIPDDVIFGTVLPELNTAINEPYKGKSFYNTETGRLYRGTGSEWMEDEGWDMTRVWDYADFVTPEYQANPTIPTLRIGDYDQLVQVDTTKHTTVEIGEAFDNCTDELTFTETYQYIDNTWVLSKKENATIQFNDLVWRKNNLFAWDMQSWEGVWDFDPSEFVKYIIQACREDLFIELYHANFNLFFFGMMRYVASVHQQVDWFYKTTYIKLNIDTIVPTINNSEKLPKRYYRDNVDMFEGYVNQVKPFHTKIRTVFDKSRVDDSIYAGVTEQDIRKEITIKFEDFDAIYFDDIDIYSGTFDTVDDSLTGGDFTSELANTIVGGGFDIPTNYNDVDDINRRHQFRGIIEESVSIKVQTNTSGSTEDADTRTLVWVTGKNGKVAVFGLTENRDSTITSEVLNTDNMISVADSSKFSTTGGIAYINGEVISYLGVYGNSLQGVTRGLGETMNTTHSAGTQIIDITDSSVLNPFETTSDFESHVTLPWSYSNPENYKNDAFNAHIQNFGKGLSV